MRANAECSPANAWHAKSNTNPTAVINPIILFSGYSGRRKSGHIQMGSGESVSNGLCLKFVTASPFGSRRRRISERNVVETGADDRLNRLTRARKGRLRHQGYAKASGSLLKCGAQICFSLNPGF